MFTSFTLWFIVLAVLIAYLCLSVGLRLRADAARRRAHERQYLGRAFDASTIAPQIQRVSQNYSASAHRRSRHDSYWVGLLATARQMVTGLSYFRRTGHDHNLKKHDP